MGLGSKDKSRAKEAPTKAAKSKKKTKNDTSTSANKSKSQSKQQQTADANQANGMTAEAVQNDCHSNNQDGHTVSDTNTTANSGGGSSSSSKSGATEPTNEAAQQATCDSLSASDKLQQRQNLHKLKHNKSLVDELKLFQNNQLLQQKDPMLQLQAQLDQIIGNAEPHSNGCNDNNAVIETDRLGQMPQVNDTYQFCSQQPHAQIGDSGDVSTVKKGVLCTQEDHYKFHEKIFNRWKKRYFILTTDYLVCFRRSTFRVGSSEMGEFLYKVSFVDNLRSFTKRT